MSSESASSAVDPAIKPAVDSTRNMAAFMTSTIFRTEPCFSLRASISHDLSWQHSAIKLSLFTYYALYYSYDVLPELFEVIPGLARGGHDVTSYYYGRRALDPVLPCHLHAFPDLSRLFPCPEPPAEIKTKPHFSCNRFEHLDGAYVPFLHELRVEKGLLHFLALTCIFSEEVGFSRFRRCLTPVYRDYLPLYLFREVALDNRHLLFEEVAAAAEEAHELHCLYGLAVILELFSLYGLICAFYIRLRGKCRQGRGDQEDHNCQKHSFQH